MEMKLKLDAIELTDTPTTTQMVNALRDIARFLSKCGGAMLAAEQNNIAEQSIGSMFNGTIQLRAAADFFEKGPNSAGLAVPQPR